MLLVLVTLAAEHLLKDIAELRGCQRREEEEDEGEDALHDGVVGAAAGWVKVRMGRRAKDELAYSSLSSQGSGLHSVSVS